MEWLAKYSRGLICTTACQGGILAKEVWKELDGEKSDMESDESDLLDGDFDDLLESIDKESEDESEASGDEIQDKIKEMLDNFSRIKIDSVENDITQNIEIFKMN
jgi:hypothetical protein